MWNLNRKRKQGKFKDFKERFELLDAAEREQTEKRADKSYIRRFCPVCGKEFACNKSFHVYVGYVGRRRKYYCSYSCFKHSKDQL